MELYYHRSPLGNFGDDLNTWIWDGLLPGWRDWDPGRVLIGVGTLLSSSFLDRENGASRRYLVAGTGVGYGDGRLPDVSNRAQWDVRSLRGPQSARRLGLSETLGILDPAMMIPTFPEFRGLASTARPVFMPHESTVERHDWAAACDAAGIGYLSPRGEAKEVIARIGSAPLVLAESMHAAILADAFRVPWIPVRIGRKFLASKWMDWATSLGLELGSIPPMFAAEERIFAAPEGVLAGYRARRRAPGRGASDAPQRPASPRPRGLSRALGDLRAGLEARHLTRALRHHIGRRPNLSDGRKLSAQVDRYHIVLDKIRRDYG